MRLRHRRAHLLAWSLLGLLLPGLLLAAFVMRGGPAAEAPQRLAAPERGR